MQNGEPQYDSGNRLHRENMDNTVLVVLVQVPVVNSPVAPRTLTLLRILYYKQRTIHAVCFFSGGCSTVYCMYSSRMEELACTLSTCERAVVTRNTR